MVTPLRTTNLLNKHKPSVQSPNGYMYYNPASLRRVRFSLCNFSLRLALMCGDSPREAPLTHQLAHHPPRSARGLTQFLKPCCLVECASILWGFSHLLQPAAEPNPNTDYMQREHLFDFWRDRELIFVWILLESPNPHTASKHYQTLIDFLTVSKPAQSLIPSGCRLRHTTQPDHPWA